TRFSMLETIRAFAEEQLAASGAATEARAAHARHFAGREADILALWDSTRQREAYTWFSVELANLRTAFRWAADHSDLDVAATIAGFAVSPLTSTAAPEITTAIAHVRDVLGDRAYESLARHGEKTTTAAMATYAYDQIDQARTELEHPG
ncbi:MAG TPA: hypothetical protein VGI68_12995, partial [Mycobacterium sp.]